MRAEERRGRKNSHNKRQDDPASSQKHKTQRGSNKEDRPRTTETERERKKKAQQGAAGKTEQEQ
jgi:hypothetical protein